MYLVREPVTYFSVKFFFEFMLMKLLYKFKAPFPVFHGVVTLHQVANTEEFYFPSS